MTEKSSTTPLSPTSRWIESASELLREWLRVAPTEPRGWMLKLVSESNALLSNVPSEAHSATVQADAFTLDRAAYVKAMAHALHQSLEKLPWWGDLETVRVPTADIAAIKKQSVALFTALLKYAHPAAPSSPGEDLVNREDVIFLITHQRNALLETAEGEATHHAGVLRDMAGWWQELGAAVKMLGVRSATGAKEPQPEAAPISAPSSVVPTGDFAPYALPECMNPNTGRFSLVNGETVDTPATRLALQLARDIYKHANEAGVCGLTFAQAITEAVNEALRLRAARSATLDTAECTYCGRTVVVG